MVGAPFNSRCWLLLSMGDLLYFVTGLFCATATYGAIGPLHPYQQQQRLVPKFKGHVVLGTEYVTLSAGLSLPAAVLGVSRPVALELFQNPCGGTVARHLSVSGLQLAGSGSLESTLCSSPHQCIEIISIAAMPQACVALSAVGNASLGICCCRQRARFAPDHLSLTARCCNVSHGARLAVPVCLHRLCLKGSPSDHACVQ